MVVAVSWPVRTVTIPVGKIPTKRLADASRMLSIVIRPPGTLAGGRALISPWFNLVSNAPGA